VALVSQHIEQQGSTQDIRSGIVANPVHGLTGSGFRGQMNHGTDIPQGQDPIPALAYVTPHHFYIVLLEQRTQLGLRIHPMDLRAQVVHQAHRHPALDQCPGERQPDEAEPSGNQDRFGHPLILTCLVSIAPHLEHFHCQALPARWRGAVFFKEKRDESP
jgi:hypothetical protein